MPDPSAEAPAPPGALGPWLVSRRTALDAGEADWLEALADFDLAEGWRADGCFSCAGWLIARCRMGRSTAYEKVTVAHELRRRPVIGEALRTGEISYTAARAIARLEDTTPDVDEALVTVARDGTVADLDYAVGYYLVLHGQEHDGQPRWARNESRNVKIRHGFGRALGSAVIALPTDQLAEIEAGIQAFIDRSATGQVPVDESTAADGTTPGGVTQGRSPVDESAVADASRPLDDASDPAPVDESAAADRAPSLPWKERRADAFMELIRTGLAHANEGGLAGADRYLVHAVFDARDRNGRAELVDGTPLGTGNLERMACDCSVVAHLVGEGREPLELGRKTRVWSAAQRRAVSVRDGGRCRWPGCNRRHADVHHIEHWIRGGRTDVDNGLLVCDAHHTLLHRGYEAEGNANDEVTFRRSDGSFVGVSIPPWRSPQALASTG